jgi:hypothetical protein
VKNIQDQLTQADPLNHVALPTLPDAAVKALAQEIVMHEQATPSTVEAPEEVPAKSPRRRRRHRLMVGLLAGLIVVPTTAAAVVGGIHTGFFEPEPPKGQASMNEPGEEYLNSNAPEISRVVKDLTSEFPLPAGTSYGPLLKQYPTTENMLVQRNNLAQDVSFYAQCVWYQDWLKGTSARRAADQATIDAIPTWKYWRFAIDEATGENSGLEILNTIASQTRVGDPTMITQYIKANCLGQSPLAESSPARSAKP